jgi:hypothetical protein
MCFISVPLLLHLYLFPFIGWLFLALLCFFQGPPCRFLEEMGQG